MTPAAALTPREREVLGAWLQTVMPGQTEGDSYKAVARRLHISTAAVGSHFANMYAKTHTCSPTQLAIAAGILHAARPKSPKASQDSPTLWTDVA